MEEYRDKLRKLVKDRDYEPSEIHDISWHLWGEVDIPLPSHKALAQEELRRNKRRTTGSHK